MDSKTSGPSEPKSSQHPSLEVIALLLLGSGFSALLYQTAWQRSFRLVFGASSSAAAAVLAVFLGGLGIGSAWLGRRAERSEKPLFFYGNLELGIAVFAAVTPFMLEGLSYLYYAVGGSPRLGLFGGTLMRLVITALVMGPPAVLMGGTLPAAARAAETDEDSARSRLALLYALNTTGAVLGALIGTFGLFELFGTRLSLWIGCLVNLLVALAARGLGRNAPPIAVMPAPEQRPASGKLPAGLGARETLIYAAALIVGAAFIALELVWYRMLSPLLGGSAFTFGLILAVALAGVGAGGYLYSRQKPVASFALFALTTALEALWVSLPFALGNRLSLFAEITRRLSAFGFTGLVSSWAMVAAITVFPAALVAGYQFPVLIALLGRGRNQVARHVGFAYAANTAGCVLGALVGGFWLIPSLGAVGVWRGVAVVLVLVAVVAALVDVTERPGASVLRRAKGALPALLLGALALLATAAQGPTATWRHASIGGGRAGIDHYSQNRLQEWESHVALTLLWERDGVETSIGLIAENGYTFMAAGKADGSSLSDRGTQVMLGLVPAALHPAPKQAFVVGLGTGMTAGWLSRVPGVKHVDVAELEPTVLDVARACKSVNYSVLERPNVSLFLGDGREFMLSTDRQYDLIISEPSNLYRAGVASLFTTDFYEVVASKLSEGGIFGQWIQTYEVDPASLLSGFRTLRSVFDFVEVWDTQPGDLVLIAAKKPISHDFSAIRQRLQAEPFATALPRAWYVEGLEGFLSHYVADAAFVDRLLRANPPPLNTDDVNILEYSFARSVGVSTRTTHDLHELSNSYGANFPKAVPGVDRNRVEDLRFRTSWLMGNEIPTLRGFPVSKRRLAVENGCIGASEQVVELWPEAAEPSDPIERFALGRGRALAHDEHALALADQLLTAGYTAEAWLIRATFQARSENRGAAFEAVANALAALRTEMFPLCNTPSNVIALLEQTAGDDADLATRAAKLLMQGMLPAAAAEMGRTQAMQRLAFKSQEPALCVKALGKQLEHPWWRLSFLKRRAACLERARHPMAAAALADVQRHASQTSGQFGIPIKD